MNNARTKLRIGASFLTDLLGMDNMKPLKRSEGPAPFGAGVTLDQEEHEQEQYCTPLLVAQPELYRQFKHGGSCLRWRARQLVKVGFGGYEEPGVSVGNLGHLTAVLQAPPGMTPSRPEHRPAWGFQFLMPN